MNENGNGGPAFPNMVFEPMHGAEGMTLRDYFAAKAMNALLCSEGAMGAIEDHSIATGTKPQALLARMAYAHADAMLKARSK